MLHIISTPIGNLEDITFRAVNLLKTCSYILAEDTRRTINLLRHYGIQNKLVSFNEFSEKRKTQEVIRDLLSGKEIAIVSDSGTPGISDPGFFLVRECVKNNIPISPVPGACAAVCALVCSGLPTDKFIFHGFFPKDNSKKRKVIEMIKASQITSVLYESPHRIEKTMELLSVEMPEKQVVLGRELTKRFEEFIRGSAQEVYEKLKDKKPKGEFVLIIN